MTENRNKTEYIKIGIFAVIVLLQICVLVYCFVVKKHGYHSDELFSYGLANSYYQPFISANDHEEMEIVNDNEWLSGEIINDYLSVNEKHRFSYDSVYYNNSKDVHPPFYYMVLHTICSFFPGIFTEWFGFGLNLVLFLLNQILIYRIVKKMTNNDFVSMAAVILYGFNQGGIDTYIFIRMYAMSTFFLLLCLYLHIRLYHEENKKYKILILLAFTTFLGGLTHYYYLIGACAISACFCVHYLVKKQYRFLLIYAVVMLAAAGMVIIAYPYVLTQLLRFEGGGNLTSRYGGFRFEWRVLVSYMVSELSGIRISIMPTYFWIYFTEVLLVLAVVLIPACFLLRKEVWFKNSMLLLKNQVKNIVKELSKINVLHISMILCVAALMVVVAFTVPVYSMGVSATRYVFPVYPVLMVLFVQLVDDFAGMVWRHGTLIMGKNGRIRNGLLMCVVLICLLINHLYAEVHYYFDDETEQFIRNYVQLDELPRDADYIFVLREFWLMNCLTVSFRDIGNFFATHAGEVFSMEEQLNELSSQNPIYLIMEIPSWRDMVGDDMEEATLDEEFKEKIQRAGDIENERTKEILKEYEQFFMKLDICECFEYIGNSAVFGREVFVFRLKS